MSWQEAVRTQMDANTKRLSAVNGILAGSVTWDPPSAAAGTEVSTTVPVTGAVPGDVAQAGFTTTLPAGVALRAFVSAADTVTVVLRNYTAGAVDLASGTLKVVVFDTL